jgi:hypothetical protein
MAEVQKENRTVQVTKTTRNGLKNFKGLTHEQRAKLKEITARIKETQGSMPSITKAVRIQLLVQSGALTPEQASFLFVTQELMRATNLAVSKKIPIEEFKGNPFCAKVLENAAVNHPLVREDEIRSTYN